jgi:GNAT superfamily N-acetyltransferase
MAYDFMDDNKVVISVMSPASCAWSELTAFKELVIEGGEVTASTLDGLVPDALALACAHENGILAGVGAIKRPYDDYRAKIFANARSCSDPAQFEFELGWFYVRPIFREKRIASKLMKDLFGSLNGRPVYATSRTNNQRMHALLNKHGFLADGVPYASAMNDGTIQLFIRR